MKVTSIIVYAFGILIGLGGIFGYVKSGSQASLISGFAFGIALIVSGYFMSKGMILAQYFALVLTFLLDALFTYRFAKTLHFFPAGFLSIASLAVLIIIALKIRRTLRT